MHRCSLEQSWSDARGRKTRAGNAQGSSTCEMASGQRSLSRRLSPIFSAKEKFAVTFRTILAFWLTILQICNGRQCGKRRVKIEAKETGDASGSHRDTDEAFVVLDSEMAIEFRESSVHLRPLERCS